MKKECLFWRSHPCLLYGLYLTLGALFTLKTIWSVLPALLIATTTKKTSFPVLVLFFLLPLPLIQRNYAFPPSGFTSSYYFRVHCISKEKKQWKYQGKIHHFFFQGKKIRKSISCYVLSKEPLPKAKDYFIEGILYSHSKTSYLLKPTTCRALNKSSPKTFDSVKRGLQQHFKKHFKNTQVRNFLYGLISGDVEDLFLRKAFSDLGLSHILAISGFHFSILFFFLHLLLRPFFPFKLTSSLLIVFFSAYFLFVGNRPSIQRAWLCALLPLMGNLLERRSSALNILGASLIGAFALDPLSSLSLSFQLTFLATGAILMLYSPLDLLLQATFPSSSHKQLSLVLIWIRKNLSLSLAVNLATFPLMLSAFHCIPLHGFFYNLFFPFLVSISLFLLALGILLCPCIPFLGSLIHYGNARYTYGVLKIMENPPLPFKTLYYESLSPLLISCFFSFLFLGAFALQTSFYDRNHMEEKKFI